ncbi:hypothetical protein RJ639_013970 [Escallonia herrerae]|uniref:Uncharacterized protein n=1 Tax=Escallonia herrerae TaxID=1293975 RepID=A0AA88VJY2_9ASTE|nr:hypothetical protein RJ639_013970 [Escallonia herrerae]
MRYKICKSTVMQRTQATQGHSRAVSTPVGGGHNGSNSFSEQAMQVESSVALIDDSSATSFYSMAMNFVSLEALDSESNLLVIEAIPLKMVDVWAPTKWQEKSKCAKTNRSTNDEPSHTSGSVPHAVIGAELKKKKPYISDAKQNLEVYKLTHKLKHDSNGQPLEEQDCPYVSMKAKAIRAEVIPTDTTEDGNDETFDELGG